MNEQQKQTMALLEKRVLERCKDNRVTKYQLRLLIREEWEKMQAESKHPAANHRSSSTPKGEVWRKRVSLTNSTIQRD